MEACPIRPAACHALCRSSATQQVRHLLNLPMLPLNQYTVSTDHYTTVEHNNNQSCLIVRVKDLQSLGQAETKLLYTLHWILLFASDECADTEPGDEFQTSSATSNKNHQNYLFSVPAISVSFVSINWLNLKIDMETNINHNLATCSSLSTYSHQLHTT